MLRFKIDIAPNDKERPFCHGKTIGPGKPFLQLCNEKNFNANC